MTVKIGSLFSGYGGLDIGVQSVIDSEVAWVSDIDKGANAILAHHHPGVPNLGDISEVNWSTVEPVDILTGGFPCQDLSTAGKRAGLSGARSGLWFEMARAIDQLHPNLVIIENVRGILSAKSQHSREVVTLGPRGGRRVGHTNRALGVVLRDLANLGYVGAWYGLRAADVGASHGRFRVFLIAQPADADLSGLEGYADQAGAAQAGRHGHAESGAVGPDLTEFQWGDYAPAIARWEMALGRPAPAPAIARKSDGKPRLSPKFVEWMMGLPEGHVTDPAIGLTRNQQLKALGNGVVPQQAAAALSAFMGEWGHLEGVHHD